jgi:hypothetical protein
LLGYIQVLDSDEWLENLQPMPGVDASVGWRKVTAIEVEAFHTREERRELSACHCH